MKIYQIDAFTNHVFAGNPAAVCPLDQWLADDVMQKIANENNLSETAFFVKRDEGYELRWFTPKIQMPPSKQNSKPISRVVHMSQRF